MSSSEVKVGAFALGGAVVLAGIITFMGAFSFGKKGYELRINYPQVSGLMPGHVVRYAGVQVGTVKKINVAHDKVEVITEINDDIKIPQGATFTISSFVAFGFPKAILAAIESLKRKVSCSSVPIR